MKYRFLFLFLPVLYSCTNLSHLSKDERADRSKKYYQEGVAARNQKKFDKAESLFRQAIRYDSSHTAAFCGVAEILISGEKFADAERILFTAPAADPNYSTYYFLLGKAQFRLSKINEAVRNLERVMRLNPDQEECGFMLAQLYFQLENYSTALKILERLKQTSVAGREKINSFYDKVLETAEARSPNLFFEERVRSRIAASQLVTRGMFAFYLVTELKINFAGDPVTLLDVATADSMFVYYQTAVASGVLEKLPDKKFRPGYVMKRRNLAHYLYLLIKQRNAAIIASNKIWNDVPLEDFQSEAIRAVFQLGVMQPKDQSIFGADDLLAFAELQDAVGKLKNLISR